MFNALFSHILSMKKMTAEKPPKRNLICLNIRAGFKKQDESFQSYCYFSASHITVEKLLANTMSKRSFNFLEDACLKILISLHLYGCLNLKSLCLP